MLSSLLTVETTIPSAAIETESSDSYSDTVLFIGTIVLVIGIYLYSRYQQKQLDYRREIAMAASIEQQKAAANINPDQPYTLAELLAYNGTDKNKPLYLGCMGKIYDVSSAAGFYGPGGPYGVFAGRDASRGLAKMEINYTTANISDLTDSEKRTLREWADKYEMKYTVVGKIVDSSEPNSGTDIAAAAATTTQ